MNLKHLSSYAYINASIIYGVAHVCIITKVPTKSGILVILLPKLAACALQRQLRVFIDRLEESFLLARFHI